LLAFFVAPGPGIQRVAKSARLTVEFARVCSIGSDVRSFLLR
jgi:hypothetical protein